MGETAELLQQFERATGKFARAAVEAAVARREEIIPGLLRILEDTVDRAAHLDAEGDYFVLTMSSATWRWAKTKLSPDSQTIPITAWWMTPWQRWVGGTAFNPPRRPNRSPRQAGYPLRSRTQSPRRAGTNRVRAAAARSIRSAAAHEGPGLHGHFAARSHSRTFSMT